MKTTVLITTSGVGAPLGDLTKYTNKALIKIGNKPAISHIVEAYPKQTRFVVTLGYFGEQVRDFLELAYPERSIEFVQVDPFVGPGSSLAETMLQASSKLQCPFVYHASDTLVAEKIPQPDRNWIGVAKGDDTTQYASWTLQEGNLRFNDKGAIGADYIHIGLIGVHDFKAFWSALKNLKAEKQEDMHTSEGEVLAKLVEAGVTQKFVEFKTWQDIGNVGGLLKAQGKSSHEVLIKSEEAIFVFDDFVIKFFANADVAANRAKRGRLLQGFVPKIEGHRGCFYRYEFVEGSAYPDVVTVSDFKDYLDWVQHKFWGKPRSVVELHDFRAACRRFYEDKTHERIAKFYANTGLKDTSHVINGEAVPKIEDMLAQIDFDWLSDGIQSRFHGDFVLDNVVRTKKGYVLVDWRQDFAGYLNVGDRYYDLAKLNHNLSVNHKIVNADLFSVQTAQKTVRCDIMRPDILVDCQSEFLAFIEREGYDVQKVEMLTALNWLNGAALHHHPYNLFLYYFGKLHLKRALDSYAKR